MQDFLCALRFFGPPFHTNTCMFAWVNCISMWHVPEHVAKESGDDETYTFCEIQQELNCGFGRVMLSYSTQGPLV